MDKVQLVDSCSPCQSLATKH